ncbi:MULTISPECIES: hypothetical protein [Planktothrix]|uniref:Uncharacterized protein n=1 Tax=Planktothrix rubescens CCAP 1459/22 TaxID=329571 RepID=A0A6J7ZU62_PLARU|nr:MULTISPECIES: hypothetical protein [Planktothrix]CAC5345936.1 conserved hypothetical protein [Planktothrix rubescens NIVA-CYA 18]CAD5951260.1 hypothetical protein PCC7821_02547 [Planktothrix rubescens NIVA-CYA 18]
MKGIQFVVNEAGEKQAVLIDLAEWGELWEDFYDVLVAHTRQDEEEVSGEGLKQEIETIKENIEDYCLNKAMDEAKITPLLSREQAIDFLAEDDD